MQALMAFDIGSPSYLKTFIFVRLLRPSDRNVRIESGFATRASLANSGCVCLSANYLRLVSILQLSGCSMSGCECKPDAKRKRDSAQPQDRAQPSSERRGPLYHAKSQLRCPTDVQCERKRCEYALGDSLLRSSPVYLYSEAREALPGHERPGNRSRKEPGHGRCRTVLLEVCPAPAKRWSPFSGRSRSADGGNEGLEHQQRGSAVDFSGRIGRSASKDEDQGSRQNRSILAGPRVENQRGDPLHQRFASRSGARHAGGH